MINQLRYESCSGSIDDLAHVVSEDCLADCLTKNSIKPDNLIKAIDTSVLPNVDKHPMFRTLFKGKHKAYQATPALAHFLIRNVRHCETVQTFLGVPVAHELHPLLCANNDDWYYDDC